MISSSEEKIIRCISEAYKSENNRIIDSKYIGFTVGKGRCEKYELNEKDLEYLNLFHAKEGGIISVDNKDIAGIGAEIHTIQLGRNELLWTAENAEELEKVDYEAFLRGEVDMPSIIYKDINVCLISGNHEGAMQVTLLVIPDEILDANNYKIRDGY